MRMVVVGGGEGGACIKWQKRPSKFCKAVNEYIKHNREKDKDEVDEYVRNVVDEYVRNGADEYVRNGIDEYMSEMPGNVRCLVLSFQRYLEKLNPNYNRLWQQSRASLFTGRTCWYINVLIEQLQQLMPTRFSPAQIMSVSGHLFINMWMNLKI